MNALKIVRNASQNATMSMGLTYTSHKYSNEQNLLCSCSSTWTLRNGGSACKYPIRMAKRESYRLHHYEYCTHTSAPTIEIGSISAVQNEQGACNYLSLKEAASRGVVLTVYFVGCSGNLTLVYHLDGWRTCAEETLVQWIQNNNRHNRCTSVLAAAMVGDSQPHEHIVSYISYISCTGTNMADEYVGCLVPCCAHSVMIYWAVFRVRGEDRSVVSYG